MALIRAKKNRLKYPCIQIQVVLYSFIIENSTERKWNSRSKKQNGLSFMYTVQLSTNDKKPGIRRYFARKIEVFEDKDYAGDTVVKVFITVNPSGLLARRIKEIEEKERIATGIESPIVVIDRVDLRNCVKSITMTNALLFRESEELVCFESLRKDTKELI